ncbi:5-oxoprolinase subunit PxpA [Algibacter miyuki]|uniref:5-oxoprolinase subunit PxpA n=1 Tax=Algibacter miyuki TaxID=1306933 RepID=A0ABV5H0T8_9FLAO|nr:5-oxoprolinase subunit PxpA [Algibacter miyuki]MDN3664102.1 5-oxoprolinase subunit PxpA [Algibacter miyuki]
MKNKTIDINVDLGEGVGNEALLMPHISSCNIACGGHAGSLETMRDVVRLAKQYRVKIGAHPSFPDKENFGRKAVDMSCVALYASIKHQIKDLLEVLKSEHARLYHIKPHGALYNLAATDKKVANVIVEVMKSLMLPVKLYVPYHSVIADLALENNIKITYEAFADRNYNTDLTLVSRQENNAIIHDADTVFEHVFRMISEDKVKTIDGSEIEILANTFCIHGDHPNAINLIKNLKRKLINCGVQIQ